MTRHAVIRAALLAMACGALPLIAGCCGIPNAPAVWQAKGWVAQGLPPGTSASAASAFLESKGFTVAIYTSGSPHELWARMHIGACFLNFTYDGLYIEAFLDNSDRVVTANVINGVSPGIQGGWRAVASSSALRNSGNWNSNPALCKRLETT